MTGFAVPEKTAAQSAAELLTWVRRESPLVHCITNDVVVNFTANVLLALGASPAMVDIPEESGGFASVAGGLLINLGTPHAERRAAMEVAARAAADHGTPWVLDPVAIGALPVRTALAHQLRDLGPSIVRGNASEILALAGAGNGGRGVDAVSSVDAASVVAVETARKTGGVVAISGPVDLITDGTRTVRVANGHELLTRVTGGGCALGAVMAAFAAVEQDRLAATTAAVLVYTIAAEQAAAKAQGPGSFAVELIDALYSITGDDVERRARVR
ncbi:hydroxyethylthiazole kinase [Kineosporia succinea]|uniref:Hydroxyethylthiazole kinase n=1 Tax=Kineosporia succinea TaxID=84632 RepID=A0ABT9PD43_9ACTN|nr:hydroxyethylthiazole kinase [Kineosporia succinea]MDP9830629.1 hydroxyethylthiazole kinase [Kineosporia succinea]